MQAKGMPAADMAFQELVAERALTVLRRLAKRGVAVKFGSGRNAQWAPNADASAVKINC